MEIKIISVIQKKVAKGKSQAEKLQHKTDATTATTTTEQTTKEANENETAE